MRQVRSAIVFAAVALLVSGAPASAAFPGADGRLVVQPLPSSQGLLLVDPGGSGTAARICANTHLCGRPASPKWSPDGRSIVFLDRQTGRIGIVAEDGSCLWCRLSPASTLRGSAPAFTAAGDAVTVASRGFLSRIELSKPKTTRLLSNLAGDAVWSARGQLAFVRAGSVWVRASTRARPRRLGPGTSPSFSPDGSRLAVVRGGWIWVVRVHDGAGRRVVRGTAPAFSPDGRLIAYIAQGHTVAVIGLIGNPRPRRLPGIKGLAVDWQPLPALRRKECVVPRGWKLIAQNAEGVIATDPTQTFPPWYGCLRALRRWRSFGAGTDADAGYTTTFGKIALAGRFAAITTYFVDKYMDCTNSVLRVDLSRGSRTDLFTQDCSLDYPGSRYAPAAVDSIGVNSSGFMTWRAQQPIAQYNSFNAISCPSSAFCAAVDNGGNVLTTVNPAGGRSAWRSENVTASNPLSDVSCPSAGLCVATSLDGLLTSSDPAGGASAWHATRLGSSPALLSSVSCASPSLCVAVDGHGDVITSTDPTGPASSWHVARVDTNPFGLLDVACPSTSVCVATDYSGNIITSTNPAGGTGAWVVTHVSGSPISSLSCPSPSLCVAVASAPFNTTQIVTSTDPAGGASMWHATTSTVTGLSGATCVSQSFCALGNDSNGEILTSTDPAGGVWGTVQTGLLNTAPLACPTSGLCIASDRGGNVATSTNPTSSAPTWSAALVDAPPCAPATQCLAESLYVRDDAGTRVIDSSPPGNGNAIGSVQLSGDSLLETWTDNGRALSAALR